MANQNPQNSNPSGITIPIDYPTTPQPGKISLLFEANKRNLYHKFSPHGHDGNSLGFDQPYIYYYPDDKPSGFMSSGGRGLPLGQGVNDLKRVTKFMASGRGLIFLGKQFMLQGFQPFDETNLYNPTEVIISAASNLSGGLLEKPKRHIDKSGGLLGGLAALIGVSISRGSPPPSTVAAGNGQGGSSEGKLFGGLSLTGVTGGNREEQVLPIQNYGNGTGLLRAKTANKARSILEQKWGSSGGANSGGFMGFLKGIAKSVFPQAFGSDKQNYKQRADDVAYEWMVKYYNNFTAKSLTDKHPQTGLSVGFMGIGLKGFTRNTTSTTLYESRVKLYTQKYFKDVDKNTKLYEVDGAYRKSADNSKSERKDQFENVELGLEKIINALQKQRNTYFDEKTWEIVKGKSYLENAFDKYKQEGEIVVSKDLVKDGFYVTTYDPKKSSDWKIAFKNDEASSKNIRPPSANTKLNESCDPDSPAAQINLSLQRVINNISGIENIYEVDVSTNLDNRVLSSGNTSKQGYDRLYDTVKKVHSRLDSGAGNHLNEGANTVQSTYAKSKSRTLDALMNPSKNFGFSGVGRPDRMNSLSVLNKDKKIIENLLSNYTEWKPYEDDLIAFFFYDVVNEKYIPFRATVRNLSESNNANWEELKFLGRADALYSYSGFTRNLAFSFTVVVNSLLELHPVWKRLNYLASSVKPSGYTKKVQNDGITNRFIIPPMFMVTIGDLYKYQPIIITAVTINIPDSAVWEIVPENSVEPWSHMADMIKSSKVGNDKIGQMPREIEVSVTCNLLEKERPIVGGNHFGHSPEDDNGVEITSGGEHMPRTENFSRNMRTVQSANVYE